MMIRLPFSRGLRRLWPFLKPALFGWLASWLTLLVLAYTKDSDRYTYTTRPVQDFLDGLRILGFATFIIAVPICLFCTLLCHRRIPGSSSLWSGLGGGALGAFAMFTVAYTFNDTMAPGVWMVTLAAFAAGSTCAFTLSKVHPPR